MSTDPRFRQAAGAFAAFVEDTVGGRAERTPWSPGDEAMPALYLGHGAPPLLNDPHWIDQLDRWAESLLMPTGIVVVSAHWERAPLTISAPAAMTPLVYDFSGFDPAYFRLRYQTPDANALAGALQSALGGPREAPIDHHRGLDHGAWVPLKVMYPDASVPTVQLSIPTHTPEVLFALGTKLRPLRDHGVLIIGSGFLTHGLQFLTRENFTGLSVPTWSKDFDAWAGAALDASDLDALFNFEHAAPGVRYAHPTVEHLSPLFVTLGAASDPGSPPKTVIDGFAFGLSKRSIEVS